MPWQIIFKIGAEEGSLTVLGRHNDAGQWQYTLVRDEAALQFLTKEFTDKELYSDCLASSWEEVLDELDVYPWAQMYPLGPFHPDHKIRIWAAVQARSAEDGYDADWETLCGCGEDCRA
jgi:hypothetical protein